MEKDKRCYDFVVVFFFTKKKEETNVFLQWKPIINCVVKLTGSAFLEYKTEPTHTYIRKTDLYVCLIDMDRETNENPPFLATVVVKRACTWFRKNLPRPSPKRQGGNIVFTSSLWIITYLNWKHIHTCLALPPKWVYKINWISLCPQKCAYWNNRQHKNKTQAISNHLPWTTYPNIYFDPFL